MLVKISFLLTIILLVGCTIVSNKNSFVTRKTDPNIDKSFFISSDGYKHFVEHWKSDENSDVVIIGIHGYSDYSNSFDLPANFLNKFSIDFYAFDLRGFGRDTNKGVWFDKEFHIKDVYEFFKIIEKKYPSKKIFILGESMGGAIAISLLKEKNINIEGLILVAPAIWDFKEQNFFLSKFLYIFSRLFPDISLSGKNLIKVIPSDNNKMLKESSEDENVIHKSSLSSLYGVVDLMSDAYKNTSIFEKTLNFNTLIILPIKDYIVPRRPIKEMLKNQFIKRNIELNNICLGVYEENYHMILRDIEGERITREIKEWVADSDVCDYLYSFSNSLSRIEESKNYHILDKN